MNKRKRQRKSRPRGASPSAVREGPSPAGAPAPRDAASRGGASNRFFGVGAALAVLAGALMILVVSQMDFSLGLMTASAHAAHGKELYGKYCVSCHGPDGQGEFNWQNRERSAPALDSSGHAWHHEDAQLLEMILDKPMPDSRMPAWRGLLTREDALDIIAYIKTTWTAFIRDNCQGANHMKCMSHQ